VPSTAGLLAAAVAALCLVSTDVRSQEATTQASLLDARAAMREWVGNERQISKERSEWAVAKTILRERIKLLEQEIASLREGIDQAEEKADEYERQQSELQRQSQRMKDASARLEQRLGRMERRTVRLLERSPAPVRNKVERLSQQIPDDPNASELSLSKRFQNVVGVLNEVNKFNREISMSSEVRQLSDGNSAQVTAVYVGVGQGYYVSNNGRIAGVGAATEDGWRWTENDAAGGHISKVIAILKNEQVAAFVPLPITIE
jgi:predicted RNase H-like nuclease (RuvC/YqgF family)